MRRCEIRSRFDNGDRIKKTLLATGNYTQYTYDRDRPDLIRAPVSTPRGQQHLVLLSRRIRDGDGTDEGRMPGSNIDYYGKVTVK